jgi:hypothetical protein
VVSRRVVESQARDFLAGKYGTVDELRPLGGGFWSSAYSFSHAGRALVVRFGSNKEWFEADRAAMAFASPSLPVPEVIELGDAFDGAYAVSARHYGTNLEDVRPDQCEVAGPMLASLLGSLYRVPKSPRLPVGWHWRPPRDDLTWRGWLCERLVDDPNPDVGDWRAALAAESEADRVFAACAARIRDLVGSCPERRDLIHGDLLHANVLVAEDASRPKAVFSWKCSVRGDFLYDVAWCTFWSPWYPGIAAADPWGRTRQEPSFRDDAGAWADASLRHHCYELHIGATHLGWSAWVGELQELRRVAAHLAEVLERGPLPHG